MKRYLKELLILLAFFGGLPFDVASDTAYAATPPLRINGLKIGANGDFYVTAFGAKCDGSTDDSTAFQSAITASQTFYVTTLKGATIFVPPGKCMISTPLNAQVAQNLRFEGSSGLGAGFGGTGSSTTPGSTIIYTGTGSTSFLQLNSAFGSVIKKLAILYSSATFTGILVDYGNTVADATYNVIDECLLGGSTATAWNAKALVSWDKGDFNVLKNSHLQGGMAGVRFREANNNYANANRIEDCLFRDFQTGAIMNAGSNEVVTGCVFEGNLNRTPPTDAPAYTSDLTADGATTDAWCKSFTFTNNWIGDYTAGHTFFDTSPSSLVTCYNFRFEGNSAPGTLHFASLRGATISNNDLGTAVNFDGAGTYTGVSILDNTWLNAVTYTNLPATAFVKGNTRSISTTLVSEQMYLGGTMSSLHFAGNSGTPTFSAGSGAGTTPTISITGSDASGIISVTTGTTPAAGASVLVQVLFASSYATAPRCVISPNGTGAATAAMTDINVSTGTTALTLQVQAAALSAGTLYKWMYICVQ